VDGIGEKYGLSKRHGCWIVGQHRGTQRYVPTPPADEDAMIRAILALASEYGRYGYRRVTALLQAAGWQVGKDRVQSIWRREGLKVPSRRRPRSRLWLNDGSCVRLRPLHRNHVWSFDFVQGQTHDGRSLHILMLIDEHSRTCLALDVARPINSLGVIEALADAMCLHGVPELVRCDNGPEMISKTLRKWLAEIGPQVQYIAPGSP
jgi:putative transposase